MSHRKSLNIEGHAHFLTFSCFQRRPLLTGEFECSALAESIEVARKIEQVSLWAYVFMPEHVHLLILPTQPDYSIPSILRRIKETTSRKIIARWRATNPAHLTHVADIMGGHCYYHFWQPGGGFDRNLFSRERITKAIEYVEWNPVRRGLTSEPLTWRWSSASARAGAVGAPLRIDQVTWESLSDVEIH